jgi:PAS domain S-box-containing protein
MKSYVKGLVPLGLGLSLALGAGLALLSFRSLAEQAEAADWVSHTHLVLERLETLRAEVLKAENAQRGFVLTADASFLERFSAARAEILKTTGELRAITGDNDSQLKRLDEIQRLIDRRIQLLEQAITSFQAGERIAMEQAAPTLAGADLTQQISRAISEMEGAEEDLLGQRDAAVKQGARRTQILVAAGTLLTFALILGVFALLRREIAERARAEEDLNRFFNVSADMMCVAGTDGYFKRLNPAWEKTLGYTVAELLARPYLDFVHPDDLAATRAAAHTASATGLLSFENRYRTKQGAHRWLNWNSSPDQQKGVIYAAARDVTESKAAAESMRQLNQELEGRSRRLETANRELEAFTSSVSHDLRAPLRHVDGFSRILIEEHATQLDPEGRRLLERVRHATQHMGELVDELLNLSRVSRREISPLVTDLNTVVREVISDLQTACQGRQVEFHAGPLPFAQCDPGLIRQVFANLLANAVKFTRPRDPAVIEVGETNHDGNRVIFVRDNGVGFSMKYAERLFGVFQRLHRPEDFEGTGVGLVTVQRIIQKHSGRIWAEAEVDRGATFFFTLDGIEEHGAEGSAPVTGGLHARN